MVRMKHKAIISGSGLMLAAVLAVATIIVVNTGLTSLRLDLTENGLFTLSRGTVNIIRSLEEPVTLDYYFSNRTLSGYPSIINYGNRVRDLLREYAAESNGKIKLTIIEPEPFSEAEDQAVASGLQGVPVNTAGDLAYFGLVGTNAIDQEKVIPFFRNERESALEYDITKLIYDLANPEKRVIGVISDLPVFGMGMPPMQGMPMNQSGPWTVIGSMQEFFDVRNLSADVSRIDNDIDILMVIHPKDLQEQTLYAIDQYLLGGGKGMFFVDPFAENDNDRPNPQNPMVMPKSSSNLNRLFDVWGIRAPGDKVVGDVKNAMRVQTRGQRGPQETLYLPWLGLGVNNLDRNDFSTGQLESINVGSAGFIELEKNSPLEMTPLFQTSEQTMLIDAAMLMLQQDPAAILRGFKSENQVRVLAARFHGHVNSAFPDGPPVNEGDAQGDKEASEQGESQKQENPEAESSAQLKEGDINLFVIADTDILSDMFWVRSSNFLGMQIKQPFADNGDFVINSLDILSGNDDMISLRSRGEFTRPFTRVESIRRDAEAEFREQEQQLQQKLKETEQRIQELQQQGGEGEVILSAEQNREIEGFRREMLNTRKELRAVQHELQKNIEHLGAWLKFINIGLMPLLIMIFALGAWFYKNRRTE